MSFVRVNYQLRCTHHETCTWDMDAYAKENQPFSPLTRDRCRRHGFRVRLHYMCYECPSCYKPVTYWDEQIKLPLPIRRCCIVKIKSAAKK